VEANFARLRGKQTNRNAPVRMHFGGSDGWTAGSAAWRICRLRKNSRPY
jgi:hypothetical protein